MKNKGFTLIELLAVIVILAIIALIAVPIILNIIDDAEKESDERSVELYAAAVKNGIAKYQLNEDAAPTEFSQIESHIKYDGARVECTTKEICADGNIYLDGCTVNGGTETYDYGKKQEGPPTRYYSWSSGSIGEKKPSDATKNVSEINTYGYQFYLGLDVDSNDTVVAAYVCFKKNETEYCLKGANPDEYVTNTAIIEDISDRGFSYHDYGGSYGIGISGSDTVGSIRSYSDGYVDVNRDFSGCGVAAYGSFWCNYESI